MLCSTYEPTKNKVQEQFCASKLTFNKILSFNLLLSGTEEHIVNICWTGTRIIEHDAYLVSPGYPNTRYPPDSNCQCTLEAQHRDACIYAEVKLLKYLMILCY